MIHVVAVNLALLLVVVPIRGWGAMSRRRWR